ncbi:FAD/NAD(P)-binding domain-containing protein [Thozetella sp. PMI_491]|nr:FAD/NAD(P)-binding domain-containing protein [Thozetella sp. PMI_491]
MANSIYERLPTSQKTLPGTFTPNAAIWPPTATDNPIDADKHATSVVDKLNQALEKDIFHPIEELFYEDSYWKDRLCIKWDIRTIKGRRNIVDNLQDGCHLTHLKIDRSNGPPHSAAFDAKGEVKGIEFFLECVTTEGRGKGVGRLAQKDGEWKVWVLYTALQELTGFEECLGSLRPNGVQHGSQSGRQSWLERRQEEQDFDNSEPTVLIIGAGQAGLSIGARLKMLNVPALIIERHDQIGGGWVRRYNQLVLHDPVWSDHMPYLAFPEFWPVFSPKDKLAEFLQAYAKLLELNVWAATSIDKIVWENEKKQWSVTVKRTFSDGREESRFLHPKHVVQAAGIVAEANMPTIKGIESFEGSFIGHVERFSGSPKNGAGKKAIVVGASNSGHDVAQDYFEQGYDVTMIQRSNTIVASSAALMKLFDGVYSQNAPPTDVMDLVVQSMPAEVMKSFHTQLTQILMAHDAPLLEGLKNAGFHLHKGLDGSGLLFTALAIPSGGYVDVGASQLIADGKIHLKHGGEIVEILPHGLKFDDGTVLKAEEIVFATGYKSPENVVKSIFGDDVANRVGGYYGFTEDGEMRNMWRETAQPGLWIHGGNLTSCRVYSKFLALQIKAQVEGIWKK